jgi:hypothetical protein
MKVFKDEENRGNKNCREGDDDNAAAKGKITFYSINNFTFK